MKLCRLAIILAVMVLPAGLWAEPQAATGPSVRIVAPKAGDRLQEVRSQYADLAKEVTDEPVLVQEALMGGAKADEVLASVPKAENDNEMRGSLEQALAAYQDLAKRYPDTAFAHLSNARIKSAAGDFAGAAEDAKKAQAVAISDQQKNAIKALIDRLNAKQDINK